MTKPVASGVNEGSKAFSSEPPGKRRKFDPRRLKLKGMPPGFDWT